MILFKIIIKTALTILILFVQRTSQVGYIDFQFQGSLRHLIISGEMNCGNVPLEILSKELRTRFLNAGGDCQYAR